MENLEKLLRKIEKNFTEKDKRQKVEFVYKGDTYEVLTMTRAEKMDLIFSFMGNHKNLKEVYQWMKPLIYKSFQLKDVALKAKDEGYIRTYYEVVDYLFEPEDLSEIMQFISKINNLEKITEEANELQKKQ